MQEMFKKLSVAGLTVALLAGSILPSQAMPMVSAPKVEKSTGDAPVVDVQYRDGYYWGHRRGGWDRGYNRGWDRRYDRRYHSRGDAWVPLAAGALIAGALIAGSAASEPRYYEPAPARGGVNPRHYDYCASRYRSYDAYSNTFQPYSGPRQQCLSPYY